MFAFPMHKVRLHLYITSKAFAASSTNYSNTVILAPTHIPIFPAKSDASLILP